MYKLRSLFRPRIWVSLKLGCEVRAGSLQDHSLALETFSSSVCLEPEGLESQKRWRLV